MSIPTITSLAPLLDRLFDQDEAARGAMRAAFADVTDADRARMMRSKTA
ncbi:MAG: O-methyltransferase, partial [Bradyrhizobium sp.]|nr:O-methyltransferase [Bradyrhizobium sp.]